MMILYKRFLSIFVFLLCAFFVFSSMPASSYDWVDISSPTLENLVSVNFYDRNNGLAVGENNTILKTSDGGNTWSQIVISGLGTPEDFVKVAYKSSNSAIILPYDSQKLYTVEGSSFITDPYINYGSRLGTQGAVIDFVDYYGTLMLGAGGSDTSYNFASSPDYGATWNIEKIVGGTTEVVVAALAFPTSYIGYAKAIFIRESPTIILRERIYKTTDAGETWNLSFDRDVPCANPLECLFKFLWLKNYGGIYSYDDQNVWMVGINPNTGAYEVVMTSDGGTSWNEVLGEGYGLFNDVKFASKNIGWAVGSGEASGESYGIYETRNGGLSWEAKKAGQYYGIEIAKNPTRVVAVGIGGKIAVLDIPTPEALSFSKNLFKKGTHALSTIEGTGFISPEVFFSNSGVSAEILGFSGSEEITLNVSVDDLASSGSVDVYVRNFDGELSTIESAFVVEENTPTTTMEITSITPNNGYSGSSAFPATIKGDLIPDGSVEVSMGDGITFFDAVRRDSQSISLFISIESVAVSGVRPLTVVVKNSLGEILAEDTLLNAFTIISSSGEAKIDSLIPLVSGGVWKSSSASAPLPDLNVQTRVSEAGEYNVVVSSSRGIEYKTVKSLSKGTNKIIIPGNREWTNGIKILTVYKGNSKSKLMIPILR